MLRTFCTALFAAVTMAASAAASYPQQQFRMAIFNTNRNVALTGEEYVSSSLLTGDDAEKWTLNYIGAGVYEIVNAATSQLLSINKGVAVAADDTDADNQRWNIVAVRNDFDGYPLYYKIASVSNPDLVLTFNPNSNSFSVDEYTGADFQFFKLNLDGLEGYAANAMTPAGEKACTIGGLLGEVVYVSTDAELIHALDSPEPKTVVVTADIDMQERWHTRIRDFKTLVGSYEHHTLYDPFFRTNNEYGKDEPSDNIVIRNFKIIAKNVPNRIFINVWSGRQVWIDHIFFESQLSYNRKGDGQDEVGKFIWINTPYESYLDKKDRLRSPDYITISYCHLKNRYWTVAYGTQNDELTRDRTTLLYNWWDKNVRRCPQLGNGAAHVLNNYYNAYGSSDNGSATSVIIGGDGSEMLSTNNRFNGFSLQQALMMGSGQDKCRDDNSYLSTGVDSTPGKVSFKPKKSTGWKPETSNYGYSLLDAFNNKGTDTKDFCTKFAGDQSAPEGMKYITNSEFDGWVTVRYPSPFLKNIEVGTDDVFPKAIAMLDTTSFYAFQNLNSGLYLCPDSLPYANGSDVIQADSVFAWILNYVGDGYYTLHPHTDTSYFLDLAGGVRDNGNNIGLWEDTQDPAQHFIFLQNADSTLSIGTRNTSGKSCLGIGFGSTEAGASVIQWQSDGTDNQKWLAIPIEILADTETGTANTSTTGKALITAYVANRELIVENNTPATATVSLSDASGRTAMTFIATQGRSTLTLPSALPAGIYFVRTNGGKVLTSLVLK